jgi:polysaccharide deacetylase
MSITQYQYQYYTQDSGDLGLNKNKMIIFAIGLLGIIITIVVCNTPLQVAHSKPSSHHHHSKSSSPINPHLLPNYQTNQSAAHLYFAPPPDPTSLLHSNTTKAAHNTNKVAMINFDDGWKSQLQYAKPILDQYGYKATFFIPCAKMATAPHWMTWPDIAMLRDDKMDIESHTMTHAHLTTLLSSPAKLAYEIGFSRQCLANQGYNTPIFAYPLNLGSDSPAIVSVVAKYYDLARTGSAPLMFTNCIGYPKDSQTDCRTYSASGDLNYANRYDIRSDSFFHVNSGHNFSPPEMFQQFVQRMNSQIPYNSNGKIGAIPIITYHNLTNSMKDYDSAASTITVSLFAQEMKYLHDNGFRILLLNQVGFDPIKNVFYLKNTLPPLETVSVSASSANPTSGEILR